MHGLPLETINIPLSQAPYEEITNGMQCIKANENRVEMLVDVFFNSLFTLETRPYTCS